MVLYIVELSAADRIKTVPHNCLFLKTKIHNLARCDFHIKRFSCPEIEIETFDSIKNVPQITCP